VGCGGVDLVCDLGGAAGTFAGAALVVRERQPPRAFQRLSWRATPNQQARRPRRLLTVSWGPPSKSRRASLRAAPPTPALTLGPSILGATSRSGTITGRRTATQTTKRRAQNNLVARRAGTSARSRTNALSAASTATTTRMSATASTARYEPSITTAHYAGVGASALLALIHELGEEESSAVGK
jgi:hypothetical protein